MTVQAKYVLALSAGVIIAVAVWFSTTGNNDNDAARPVPAATQAAHTPALALRHNQWGQSPFSSTVPQRADEAVRVARRRAKMAAAQYETPPQYYTMSLAQLQKLAGKGDVFAMIQLGEQYAFEQEALEFDPAFDVRADPKGVSKHFFIQAIGRGYTHLASVLASQALEGGNLVEAYSWHLLAESYNDVSDGESHRRKAAFLSMSQEQTTSALKSYREKETRLGLPHQDPPR